MSFTSFPIPTTAYLPPLPVNQVATSGYQFQATDGNAATVFTVGCAATIPANLFGVGTVLTAINFSTGTLSISSLPGVTLQPNSPVTAVGPYSVVGVIQVEANAWVAYGNFF